MAEPHDDLRGTLGGLEPDAVRANQCALSPLNAGVKRHVVNLLVCVAQLDVRRTYNRNGITFNQLQWSKVFRILKSESLTC